MALTKCEECGTVFEAHLDSCPSCGCPNDNQIPLETTLQQPLAQAPPSSQPTSPYDSAEDEIDYDYLRLINEPSWLAGIKPWHFTGRNEQEQGSYNVLNDFLLMANLGLKIGLYVVIIMILYYIPLYLLLALLTYMAVSSGNNAEGMLIFTYIIMIPAMIFYAYLFVKTIIKAVSIYWIPLFKTHRRIHARYWRAMDRATKQS